MSSQSQTGVKCSASLVSPSLLLLSYEGFYPAGSEGNEIANVMTSHALEAYRHHVPRAIMFDLSRLDYVWGDAICGIVGAIVRERHEVPLSLPTCVLACGRTHKALKPLFGRNWMFGLAGTTLINERDEALSYLNKTLEAKGEAG